MLNCKCLLFLLDLPQSLERIVEQNDFKHLDCVGMGNQVVEEPDRMGVYLFEKRLLSYRHFFDLLQDLWQF